MEEFSVKTELKGAVTVVHISGRIDSSKANELDSELTKIASASKKLVLDLHDVAYLSSAGVRSIVRLMKGAAKSGGGVKLGSTPKNILEILEMVGVLEMLERFPTVDEAVASF